SANWQWEARAMRLAGELRQPWRGGRTLALHLDGDVPLGPVAHRVSVGGAVEGTAHVDVGVAGPIDAPRVAGRIAIPALDIGGVDIRDVAIGAHWADRRLAVDDLAARLGRGQIKGRATASLVAPSGADVEIAISALTLPDPLSALGAGNATARAQI